MVVIFLSGCHGIGKTTFINNLYVGKPLVKIVDTDIIPFDGIGYRQQMARMRNFRKLLARWRWTTVPVYDVIVDRSPFDFYVYNKHASRISGEAIEEALHDEMDILMKDYHEANNNYKIIGVIRDYDEVLENIRNRDRHMWNENNEGYNRRVYEDFEALFNSNRHIITTVAYHNLDHYVKQLLEK